MKTIYDPRYIRFIDHLRAARCKSGLTQAQAAYRIKMSRAWIGKIERREIRLDCLHGAQLCVVYRVDVGRLVRKMTEAEEPGEEGLFFTC